MSIMQRINEHIGDSRNPRYTAYISNDSGSFTLPKGFTLFLKNCTGTCTGNEGNNRLEFIGGTPTVENFNGGLLRFENPDGPITVNATNSQMAVKGAEITQLTLDTCIATIVDCEVTEASYTDSKIKSIENTYEQLTVDGGKLWSFKDEFSGNIDLTDLERGTFIKVEGEGDFTSSNSTFTMKDPQLQGDFTVNGTELIVADGEFQGQVSVTDGTATFKGTQFDQQASFSEAQVNLTSVTFQQESSCTSGSVSGSNVTATLPMTLGATSALFTNSTFQQGLVASGSLCNLDSCTIQEELTFDGKSLKTSSCTINGDISISNGTIDSNKDTWQGTAILTGLTGPNILRKLSADLLTAIGDNSGNLDIQQSAITGVTTIRDWHAVKVIASQFTQATINGVTDLDIDQSSVTSATVTNCQKVSVLNSSVELLTLANSIDAILMNITSVIATDSRIADAGSTFAGLIGCTLSAIGSTVTSADDCVLELNACTIGELTDCVGTAQNSIFTTTTTCGLLAQNCAVNGATYSTLLLNTSTFDGTAFNAIFTTGGDGENVGLTAGCTFTADAQAAALLYDGNTTLQASLGNLNMFDLVGSIFTSAFTGNIAEFAAMSISETAAEAITEETGGLISMTAGSTVSVVAGDGMQLSAPTINLLGLLLLS